jgi:hypothetical protein
VQEAASFLPEVQRLAREIGNSMDLLRCKWLEGRIAAGLGKWEEAGRLIDGVRQAFAGAGMAYDTALANLELAMVYLEQGCIGEVKELAAGLVPVFQQQGVHDEARKALALFCRAVEQEIATAELARQVVAYLYRAQHDPSLRFEIPR